MFSSGGIGGLVIGLVMVATGCSGPEGEPGAAITDPSPAAGGSSAVRSSDGGANTSSSGGAPDSTSSASGGSSSTGCEPVTERRVRRLTAREYVQSVIALTGAEPVAPSLPDPIVHGFDNNADALNITAGNFDEYAIAAELSAANLDVDRLAPCGDEGDAPRDCARAFAQPFASLAYGRDISETELESLLALYDTGNRAGGYATGIRLIAESVLLSPFFLYRTELGVEGSTATAELTPEEKVNALSFALTGARPDAELVAWVQAPERLSQREEVEKQARRLVTSDAGRQHLAHFVRGLFGVLDLRLVNKEPVRFPIYTPAVKADLDREIELFLERALGPGGGTWEAVLGADTTFMNQNLFRVIYAADYAPAEAPRLPSTGEFVAVPLNTRIRRGLLGLAGWEAAHSPIHRSSPVDRAVNVRSRLLCAPIPPPVGLMFTSPPPGDETGTTRQKFEVHTRDQACQACHRLIDPLGFGLEMIDALGRYREQENNLPVDSSGALVGTDVDGPFSGPAELSLLLLKSQQARECVAIQWFRFSEGREEESADACVLEPLKKFFARGSRSFADLAVETALQRNFMRRRREP
ncbi:MAG TPA: DUF1588 domain-containing protein [Polyangiaceae bacterium]|nr:DUF1588 domain-containing protein [Polyangiaceae bacterium]